MIATSASEKAATSRITSMIWGSKGDRRHALFPERAFLPISPSPLSPSYLLAVGQRVDVHDLGEAVNQAHLVKHALVAGRANHEELVALGRLFAQQHKQCLQDGVGEAGRAEGSGSGHVGRVRDTSAMLPCATIEPGPYRMPIGTKSRRRSSSSTTITL